MAGFGALLVLGYVLVLVTVAVLVIWALVLTIQLLRSVLAERRARGLGFPSAEPPRAEADRTL
ncbi:hypothetical protein [Cellulosimicrobium marinum]|uniref:hypothetical protein n=1 Tax=Cellulosimicrobium marinum TaxID=1638992 RepID=UPI001E3ACCD1|nr:hypothetical protein [Cellulosimicrobium marinum]MCB7135919.1 hypothetical protein [Cellulosimicrobium marinum]